MTRKQRAKKQPKNPTVADLPQNPEFQRFAAFTGAILQVSKQEIDTILAEERELKEKLTEEVEEIEERLSGSPECVPD